MVIPKTTALALSKLLGQGHFVLHVDAGVATTQRVVNDAVLDDEGNALASLQNLGMMCGELSHV